MSKKGVDALSNLPPWIRALVDPDSLERLRQNQRQEHSALQDKLRVQKMQAGDAASLNTKDFPVKQHILSNNGKFVEDNFPAGSELKWIQAMKTFDIQDPDITHDNTDAILRTLHGKHPSEIQTVQVVLDQTKDQKKLPKREVNDIFIDNVMANLEKSDSKSLIIHLTNPKNEIDPLALVLLQGSNGIWLHDPKYKASIKFDDVETAKKFLKEHILINHEGFNHASITQVYNKDITSENKQKMGADATRAETITPSQAAFKLEQQSQFHKSVAPTSDPNPAPTTPESLSKTTPKKSNN